MKTITRTTIYLTVSAMILAAALAVPVAAQQPAASKGALQGHDEDKPSPLPNSIVVKTTGTGIDSLIGDFSFTLEATVNLLAGTETGTAHLTAANGDTLDATTVGSGQLTAGGVITIMEIWSITGGTGRFAGAKGRLIVERLASPGTFSTCGSFQGAIFTPGTAH